MSETLILGVNFKEKPKKKKKTNSVIKINAIKISAKMSMMNNGAKKL